MFQCDCPPDDCAGRVRLHLAGDRAAGDALAQVRRPGARHRAARAGSGPPGGVGRRLPGRVPAPFTNLGKWEERCPFCKWLAVVAARRAIDLMRLTDRTTPLPDGELADPRPPPPDRETMERIEGTVARFPPEWRRVWEWWVQGVRRDEMARRAGKSLRTVQYWLAEMIDQVREQLEE